MGQEGTSGTPDARAALAELIPGFTPPADGMVRGIVLVGLGDGAVLRRLVDATAEPTLGYTPTIEVIDPGDDALAAREPPAWACADARVSFYLGGDAVTSWRETRRRALDRALPKHLVASDPAAGDRVRAALAELRREQGDRAGRLRDELRERAARSGRAGLVERFRALRGSQTRARVVICTSRFSTFVWHSAGDLAEAFVASGHEAFVLAEPDDHSTLTALSYLEALREHRPDVAVLINFPRSSLGAAIPPGVPTVCWVQDAMAHLFSLPERSAGPLDFMAGHIFAEPFARAGYGEDACLEFPTTVSPRKFHTGPVPAPARRRFACDIAYVSHRSETPAEMHDRFMRNSGLPAQHRAAIERLRERVEHVASDPMEYAVLGCVKKACVETSREIAGTADAELADLLRYQYAAPLAEQFVRHRTLAWASEIAGRHGLELKLFGRGWEDHPTLAAHAAGEVEHGEALRACYASAAVHLHPSVQFSHHQRVFECALSGGLPLCTRLLEEHKVFFLRAVCEFARGEEPDTTDPATGEPAWTVADHPALMAITRWQQLTGFGAPARFGLGTPGLLTLSRPVRRAIALDQRHGPATLGLRLLGDPGELTVSCADDLERRVLRASGDPLWRRAQSAQLAARVHEAVSTDRFAAELLRLVADRIAPRTRAPGDRGEAA